MIREKKELLKQLRAIENDERLNKLMYGRSSDYFMTYVI